MEDPAVSELRHVRIAELLAENREHEASFDLRWKADMRAIKRWQQATGRVLVWPDHADLCVWLLERNDEMREALERFIETTAGEDAVSGMALHGPITLARAALRKCGESSGQETSADVSPQAE